MPTLPYLRTQAEIVDDVRVLIRDTGGSRFPNPEPYHAMNQALSTWHDKVKVPYLYTITGGYAAGTKEYTIPAYVRPPIYPEIYLPEPYFEYTIESYSYEWQELMGWDYNVNGSGAHTLTVYNPRSEPGQLWFYAPNSRVPVTSTLPVTSGSTAADATSIVLSTVVDVDDVGHVKIESEYISYAGVTRGASTTTLLNCVRGLYGSTAAAHDSGTTVYWCVAVDTMALYNLLSNQARAILAAMPLFDGGTHERTQYEKQMGYYQQLADEYWKMYNPDRPTTNIRLNRKSYAFR